MQDDFSAPSPPPCCGSGCAVCVLDYADDCPSGPSTDDLLKLLEAVETAERQISKNH